MNPQPRGADAPPPYLSVVLASRNDDYAGGMLKRLQVSIDAFLEQMERHALPSELIVIDWNPPPGRTLWDALAWPSTLSACTIRVITVPPAAHARLPFADRLPILIHRARNVGVRRARGAFVLPTSPDILLSDELVEEINRRQLDPKAVYRIARHDVPEAALDVAAHDDRLAYCRDHVTVVHDRQPSYRVPGLPQLFTNGAGDFTLLSRDSYVALRGIPEEREYHSMHFDSVFCFMAHAAGLPEVVFEEPCRIYHVDHGVPSWRLQASWLERLAQRLPLQKKRSKRLVKWARRVSPPRSGMDRRGVPYLDMSTPAGRAEYEQRISAIVAAAGAFHYNPPDWGLGGETLSERVIGH
jgi:hypothetical protein